MRKNKNFKTYGRHKNRVITTDVWVSDNEKRKNVFSTSSEFDSSKQSSLFQLSSSGSEKSEGSSSYFVFESNKKTRQGKTFEDKENIPVSRQKKTGIRRAECQNLRSSASSTDCSYEAEKKTTRRALRDRNKKVDYNDSANLKKQLKGTTAKRKRAVKTNNAKIASDSVNFSEFDEYSLLISDSPVDKNNKQTIQDLIETSTPVAKRTRCKENTFDRIRNSDLSNIEAVSSPVPDTSYSVCTPASSLPGGLTCSASEISVPSSISDHNSKSGSRNELESSSKSNHVIKTPESAVVQMDRLRESFILKHVSERRKTNKDSRLALQAVLMTPEDVFVKLQKLTDSFISSHSGRRKINCQPKRLNNETNHYNNSLSLFESPFISTRNREAKAKNMLRKTKDQKVNSSIEGTEDLEAEEEYDDDNDDEDYEIDENDDEESISGSEIDDLSAINEDEEECSEEDADEREGNDSVDNDEISELQDSMKDLQISDKHSGVSNETLYMLNDDYQSAENASDDTSGSNESADSYEISGSRDLFSTNPGISKISLRSAKNFSKSDYFTASSSHVSEENYVTADDDDDCDLDDDGNENEESVNSPEVQVRKPYHLRDKHLQSLQDSFKELLTPTKKRNSLVPLSARTKLLVLCDQSSPVPFQEVISQQMLSQCKKIGEGVYGEVFRTCSVAFKIIPIEGDFPVNDEPQKKFEEILPEVVIAKELSSLRHCKTSMTTNFCEVKSVSLVKGKYPANLLKEWDSYNKKKGSENDRPDMFTDNQLFILFEFADCGRDLESFEFENMYQAKSVLAQVVYALAVAEESLQFEHRDLHWGNILVKPTEREDITYKLMGKRCSVPSMGVEANVIDFTLSRLTKDQCSVYIDLAEDDSLFEGKGDYQFDIYRKMKEENGNNWETFSPHSNVLWLHYLADKLVYAKRYPPQSGRQDRDILRQFRQFLGTILDYQSACEMAIDAHFLNS